MSLVVIFPARCQLCPRVSNQQKFTIHCIRTNQRSKINRCRIISAADSGTVSPSQYQLQTSANPEDRKQPWAERKKKQGEEEEEEEDQEYEEPETFIDETDPERQEYNQKIFNFAKEGDADSIHQILYEMDDKGLPPGPKAYHAVVYCYVLQGNSEAALDAIREEYHRGISPLRETYTVLIHGFVKEGNIPNAEAVLASMRRARKDAEYGWRILCSSLMEHEFWEEALKHINLGRSEGWIVDEHLADIMTQVLVYLDRYTEAFENLAQLRREGTQLEATHFNNLIMGYASKGQVEEADNMLRVMYSEYDIEPDADSYNAILAGLIQAQEHPEKLYARMQQLMSTMISYQLEPNAVTYGLQLAVYLRIGRLEQGVVLFMKMAQMQGNPIQDSIVLDDNIIIYILEQLCAHNKPVDLLICLQMLLENGRHLPKMRTTDNGLSVVTAWLIPRLARLQIKNWPKHKDQTPFADIEPEFVDQEEIISEEKAEGIQQKLDLADISEKYVWQKEDELYEMEDIMFLKEANVAVDQDGVVYTPSKMSVLIMRAEARASGIDDTGKRDILYKRIKEHRKSVQGIVNEYNRKLREFQMKEKREEAFKQLKEGKVVGVRDEEELSSTKRKAKTVQSTFVKFIGGKEKEVTESGEEVVVEEEEEGEGEGEGEEEEEMEEEIEGEAEEEEEEKELAKPKAKAGRKKVTKGAVEEEFKEAEAAEEEEEEEEEDELSKEKIDVEGKDKSQLLKDYQLEADDVDLARDPEGRLYGLNRVTIEQQYDEMEQDRDLSKIQKEYEYLNENIGIDCAMEILKNYVELDGLPTVYDIQVLIEACHAERAAHHIPLLFGIMPKVEVSGTLKRTEISEMYGRLVRCAATGGEPTWGIQMVGECAERGFSISPDIVELASTQYGKFEQQLANMEDAGYIFDDEAQVVEIPGGRSIFPVEVKYGEVKPEYYLQMAKDLQEIEQQMDEEQKELERMRKMEEEGYVEEQEDQGQEQVQVKGEVAEVEGDEEDFQSEGWFEGEGEEEEEEEGEEEEEEEEEEEI